MNTGRLQTSLREGVPHLKQSFLLFDLHLFQEALQLLGRSLQGSPVIAPLHVHGPSSELDAHTQPNPVLACRPSDFHN